MVITFVWSLLGIQLQIDTRKQQPVEEEDTEPQMLPVAGTWVGSSEPEERFLGFCPPSTY